MRKAEKEALKDKKFIKPPIVGEKISCDDYEIDVDGTTYYPHLDEWIEVVPVRRLSDVKNILNLVSLRPNDTLNVEQYDAICSYLASSIKDWNFTDDEGSELAKPFRNPSVFETLSVDELNYLLSKIIGGRTDEGKKD